MLTIIWASVSHNLFAGGKSCRMLMAVGWSGYWWRLAWLRQFLKISHLLYWLTLHKWFLCSTQCCLIAFYSQYNFFQNWSRSSQTLPLLYLLGLCNILNLCCHFNSLYSIFKRSRFHLKKPLSMLIHKKQLLNCRILSWDVSILVTSSGPTSDSSFQFTSLL